MMIHVTCAVIIKNNSYLICQRSPSMKLPLKWEFPGGKLEEGESLEECLTREIFEELNISISINRAFDIVVHHYEFFSITLYPFLCEIEHGVIELKEHIQFRWVKKSEFSKFDLAPADLPIINQL